MNNKKKYPAFNYRWGKMAKMRYVECLEFEICDKWRKIKSTTRKNRIKNIFYGYFVDMAEWEKKGECLFASANFN